MKHLIGAFLLSLPLLANAAEINPPVHPDEAAVIRGIVSVENYQAATVVNMPGWLINGAKRGLALSGVETDSLKGWMIEIKSDPRPYRGGFFSCLYNADGRIVALSGNGPWLRNESLRALKAMPELRSIHWDHNGFVMGHPEYALYDGTGFDALVDSKLVDIKIGLSFNDKGMEQCAKIKGLRSFTVAHSQATEAGIEFFAGHPGLTRFSVAEMASKRVTEKALGAIAKIPNLTHVGFGECYVTYAGGFALLGPLKGKLTSIDLTMSVASQADLDKLKADHPQANLITTPLAEIPKRHIGVAMNLAKQVPPELAVPLNAAIEQFRKK
jgi:hypothetical protein